MTDQARKMTSTSAPMRVLVVDDEPRIVEDYRYVLGQAPKRRTDKLFSELEEDLFGSTPKHRMFPDIDLSTFQEGSMAVEAVREAMKIGEPFALAFIDMRMPLGISGLETSEQIRELDPYCQIVIVTAYSDVHPYDITERVPPADRLSFLLKPFHAYEIQQLAVSLSAKWRSTRRVSQNYENVAEPDLPPAAVTPESPPLQQTAVPLGDGSPQIGVLRYSPEDELLTFDETARWMLDDGHGWLVQGKSYEQVQWSLAHRVLAETATLDPSDWVQRRISDEKSREEFSRIETKAGRSLLVTEKRAQNGDCLAFYVDVTGLKEGTDTEARVLGSLLGTLCEEIDTKRNPSLINIGNAEPHNSTDAAHTGPIEGREPDARWGQSNNSSRESAAFYGRPDLVKR